MILLSLVAKVARRSIPKLPELTGEPSTAISTPRFLVFPMFWNCTPGNPREGRIGSERIASLVSLL